MKNFLYGFHSIYFAIVFRLDYNDNIDRCAFFEELNWGWNEMNYKYEFEKFWGKGAKVETMYVSAEDYDALVERLNQPPDPEVQKRFREILNRKAPWED